ncbi:MAG: DNA cytosine methyltransferase [Proteobacteria bacterium]|nr:DNA cytosine methyltransferase [Pseudomonadota bacterium]
MKELSLFTGSGGGLLGSMLLGWETLGYVEFNEYSQQIIAKRIEDGILHRAPIFSDIKAFISEGYAASYKGMVDVVSGGFPCQEFSVAGARKGNLGSRNLWPEMFETVRIIKPRFVYAENVPGILSSRMDSDPTKPVYFGAILRDLASLGYGDIRYSVLGADDVGANHRRKRVWILAHSECLGRPEGAGEGIQPEIKTAM